MIYERPNSTALFNSIAQIIKKETEDDNENDNDNDDNDFDDCN